MKNLFLSTILLLAFVGCSSNPVKKTDVVETPVSVEAPVVVTEEIKEANLVKVLSYTNFRKSEQDKIVKAAKGLNEMVMGECFKEFMLKQDLRKTNGRTNLEVVEHIRKSYAEVHLIMYYKRWSKVHGYTYPNVNKIWFNRKYHSGTTVKDEASNYFHELLHKYGYKHDSKATKLRPLSVPYTGNKAVKACFGK